MTLLSLLRAVALTLLCTPALAADGGRHLVVDGVRLWLREAGPAGGTPLLFLHGGPGYNSHSFAVQAGPLLEPRQRLIYLDQRGSGRSERPWTGDYSIARLVTDLEGLRRQLGIRQWHVAGHSFGGLLALEYAAAHPDRVRKLVLISAASDIPAACQARVDFLAGRYAEDLAAARARQAAGELGRHVCDLAFNSVPNDIRERVNDETMFPRAELAAAQAAVDAASGLRNTGELGGALFGQGLFDYRFSQHARLRMPTLVLAGGADHAIGLPAQRALAAALPQARLVELPAAGHFLYLDEPQRFSEALLSFLH